LIASSFFRRACSRWRFSRG